jgi:hypothetical protein
VGRNRVVTKEACGRGRRSSRQVPAGQAYHIARVGLTLDRRPRCNDRPPHMSGWLSNFYHACTPNAFISCVPVFAWNVPAGLPLLVRGMPCMHNIMTKVAGSDTSRLCSLLTYAGVINTVNSRVCSHVLLPSPSLHTISFISVQKRPLGNCKVQKKLSFP